jgi:hypothetical protein
LERGALGKPLGSRTNRNNIIVLLASSVTCLGVQTSLASTCATQTHGKCVTLVISISRAAVAKGLIVGWERRSNCGCTLTRSRECLRSIRIFARQNHGRCEPCIINPHSSHDHERPLLPTHTPRLVLSRSPTPAHLRLITRKDQIMFFWHTIHTKPHQTANARC